MTTFTFHGNCAFVSWLSPVFSLSLSKDTVMFLPVDYFDHYQIFTNYIFKVTNANELSCLILGAKNKKHKKGKWKKLDIATPPPKPPVALWKPMDITKLVDNPTRKD